MARYDFTSISPQDFEDLVRDLLQAEWNVVLEAFKTGRDTGIDLRYAPADGGATIVQCKHYAVSGFNKLLAHLRDIERPKIERLRPSRYVIATTVALTPPNKDEIVDALQPFLLGTRDVFGAGDLDGLLSRHPEVERANFKLWLTSTSVLDRVLHNAELCQTDFEVDRIRRKLPLFVQNDAFPRAKQLLEESRVVVVSGEPGIGKTTLAEMLLYAHLDEGYEPVVIQAEVAEGKKCFKSGAKKIFYFDDFLGQTFLGDRVEYLGRNQDVALVDFMEMIRQSAHGRFILTTREHLLNKAVQVSERLAHSPMLDHRCVIELRDYSFEQRARILYNHLYFSDLPLPFKEAVLEDDFFLAVIRHPHFNPRLIEWLSSYARVRAVAPRAYRAHISGLLESPEAIWSHAYRNQISAAARHVLLSLSTLGTWTNIVDLEPAFISLHRYCASRYHHSIAPGDFRVSLRELDGAFLSYSSGYASFLNPSILEFVASVIASERDAAEDLVNSAVRFKQIDNLWRLAAAHPNSALHALLASHQELLYSTLSRLVRGPSTRWEKMPDGRQRGFPIDWDDEAKIGFLVAITEIHQSPRLSGLASLVVDTLVASWSHQVVSFSAVLRLLEEIGGNAWFLAHGGREMYRKLLNGVLEGLALALADDWIAVLAFQPKALEWNAADESSLSAALTQYQKQGVRDERFDCTTLDEMTQFRESLDQLKEAFGLDFGRAIERLDEDIAEREEEKEPLSGGSWTPNSKTTIVSRLIVTDEDVREMFSTLISDR